MSLLKRLFRSPSREVHSGESLTGEWHGHYEQCGSKRRIVARLTQEGDGITGEMADVDTVSETPLYDSVAEAGLPPGTDEEIAKQFRSMIPNAPRGPLKIRSVLPEASKLAGSINGRFVRFTKTYQGECTYDLAAGDATLRRTTEGHSVEYHGELSADKKSISGRWSIYVPGGPQGGIEGDFDRRFGRLRSAPPPEAPGSQVSGTFTDEMLHRPPHSPGTPPEP